MTAPSNHRRLESLKTCHSKLSLRKCQGLWDQGATVTAPQFKQPAMFGKRQWQAAKPPYPRQQVSGESGIERAAIPDLVVRGRLHAVNCAGVSAAPTAAQGDHPQQARAHQSQGRGLGKFVRTADETQCPRALLQLG